MCSGPRWLFLKSISIFYCSITFFYDTSFCISISSPSPSRISIYWFSLWSVMYLFSLEIIGIGNWMNNGFLTCCLFAQDILVSALNCRRTMPSYTQHTRQGRKHSTKAKRIEYVYRKWVSFLRYWNDGPFSAHRQSSSIMDEKYLQ